MRGVAFARPRLILSLLLLVAASPWSGAVATATSTWTPIATPTATRDRVIVGLQLEPPTLDPTESPASAISEVLYGNVYEGLVRFAADGSAAASLAESWEISPDGLTYVFRLRSGVRFSDGTPFDAGTAKFTLDRVIAPGSINPQRTRLAALAAVDAVDAHTLRLRLARRSGGLLQALAGPAFVMLSPTSAATNAQRPVGTGPFRFVAWRRGDSIELSRNPGYWGGPARLAGLTFRFIADPTAAYAALMAGDIDLFSNYPAPESFPQFARDARFVVFVGPSESETILGLNHRRAPLDNLLVRRAISMALDRRAIIDGAMFGLGTPIGSHFPPTNPAYVDLTGRYPHDAAAAKALLKQAGYPGGFSLTLKLPPPAYARRSGEIIAAQLAQVGIRVVVQDLEWAQWLDEVFTRHDFDMSIVAHAEPMDYDIYGRDDYYFGYVSPEFKALLAALEETSDPAKRAPLLRAVQQRLAEDAVNGFLFQLPWLCVWNADLRDVALGGVLDIVDFHGAHFVSGTPPRGAGADSGSSVTGAGRPGWMTYGGAACATCALGLVLLGGRRLGPGYLGSRLLMLLATLAFATVVVFTLVQIVPGDPAHFMLGLQADPEAVAGLRHRLGLDTSLGQRYLGWVAGLAHGDFGISYTYRIPVATLLAQRLQVSVPLAAYALTLTICAALPLGLVGAATRGRPASALLSGLTQLGLAIPNFWLGLLLILVFAIDLRWVAAGGFPGWQLGPWVGLKALSLPAIALATPQAAVLARVLRGALVDTLHEDYIRTARAQGAGEWRILWRHALPNAAIPVLTILGMQFSFLLAGGVIIENVFFLPGVGRLVFQAIAQRDLIVVQSVVMVLIFAVVAVTFCVDIGYSLIDPRLRAKARGS
jgi:ABC-type dipeptide/oligopeptide/nickel transport system permease component/ABC-type transport system substrate-binding protein